MRDSFLKYLEYEKRFSQHTINSYKTDLDQFISFVSSNFPDLSISEVSHNEIRGWVIQLSESGLKPRSINRKIASIRAYYKFLLKREQIRSNPTKNINVLKTQKNLPEFIRESELIPLLDQFEFEDDFNGWRDRLVLEILYGTGIRLSELINLKDNDIDYGSGLIKVLGKRNKERLIPISKSLNKVIKNYQEIRNRDVIKNNKRYVVLTDDGKKGYPMLIYRIVKKYLASLSSDKSNPHLLRHTFATHLLNKGAELNAVKDLLGHANLAATQVYTHNSVEKLKKVFDQAHPKA